LYKMQNNFMDLNLKNDLLLLRFTKIIWRYV